MDSNESCRLIWTLRSAGDRLLDTQEATGSNPVVSTQVLAPEGEIHILEV